MATPIIEPIEHRLDSKGRAGVLFVAPWTRRDMDIEIDGSENSKKFFSVVSKAIPSYAAVTMKRTPGMWKDSELDEKFAANRKRIDAAIEKYRPGIVVFLGVNFSKMLIPELKNVKHDLKATFSKYRQASGKRIPAMVWGAPDSVVEDVYEYTRMPETLSKLWFFAKRMHYERKPDIENLTTYRSAAEYIDFLANEHTGIIGFDTETYSLNRVHHQRLGSMQFCSDAYDSKVLLWDSKHQELSKRDLERLTPKLVHLFGSSKTSFDCWTMHHGMFDVAQVRGAFKCRMPKPIIDTMYFAHLMDENRQSTARISGADLYPFALKTLVLEFLGFTHYSDEAMKARNNGTLMDLPLPDFLAYSGYDPIVTYRMYDVFKKWAEFEKYDKVVLNLLRHLHSRAIGLYSDMSRNGIAIDDVKLRELLSKYSVINKRLVEIQESYKGIPEVQAVNKELAEEQADSSMFFKVPFIFDMKKTKHRTSLLFHSKRGFKFQPNEEGKFSTGKAFQKLHMDNPVVALYTEAQGLVKLRDAYIKPLFENMFAHPDPNSDTSDGRVHPEVQLHRTVTGRAAVRGPNTQQVPRSDTPVKKEIKALFIPGPGKIFVQADLSSAEVRVWGALSGDEVICRLSREAFKLLQRSRAAPDDLALKEEANLMANFHKQTYGLCYNVSPASVTPAQRQIAKKLTFGICYGMSDNGLARELGVTVEEAVAIKKLYFAVYKGGEKWLADTQEFALTNGYVQTPLGRRRRMPQVFTGDRKFISEAKRFAVNAPIQATASDYAMLSTCILNDAIIAQGLEDDVKIVNAVHDSVVIEVTATAEWLQFVSKLVRRCFTKDVVVALKRDFDFELKAPIDIDIEASQHKQKKCKKCGSKHSYAETECLSKVKTGKKDKDGKDILDLCKSTSMVDVKLNGGWGYLEAVEENARGYARAASGF